MEEFPGRRFRDHQSSHWHQGPETRAGRRQRGFKGVLSAHRGPCRFPPRATSHHILCAPHPAGLCSPPSCSVYLASTGVALEGLVWAGPVATPPGSILWWHHLFAAFSPLTELTVLGRGCLHLDFRAGNLVAVVSSYGAVGSSFPQPLTSCVLGGWDGPRGVGQVHFCQTQKDLYLTYHFMKTM